MGARFARAFGWLRPIDGCLAPVAVCLGAVLVGSMILRTAIAGMGGW